MSDFKVHIKLGCYLQSLQVGNLEYPILQHTGAHSALSSLKECAAELETRTFFIGKQES